MLAPSLAADTDALLDGEVVAHFRRRLQGIESGLAILDLGLQFIGGLGLLDTQFVQRGKIGQA